MKNSYRVNFILFILILIFISLISNIWYIRKDATKQKLYTLSEYTKNVLDSLNSTVTLSYFRSSKIASLSEEAKYIFDILEEFSLYAKQKCIIKLYSAEEIEEKKLNELSLIAQQIEEKTPHGIIRENIYSGIVIELKGTFRTIPFIASISNLEYNIVNFILQINESLAKRPSKINLLYAIKENAKDENQYITKWLEYEGIKLEEIELPLKEELDIATPILIIGSEKIDENTATFIDVFLKKRGNAIVFVSGNTIDIKGTWKAKKKSKDFLLEVLAKQGIEIKSNLVMDIANYPIKMIGKDGSSQVTINYPFWPTILKENIKNHAFTLGIPSIQTFWPSSIILNLEKNKYLMPFITSTKEAITIEKGYNTDPFSSPFSLFNNVKKDTHTIACVLEKPSRIAVISDENMIGSAIEYTDSRENLNFATNLVLWSLKRDKLLELKGKRNIILPFKFYEKEQYNFIILKARVICFIIIPVIILSLAIYFFIKKRKTK